MPKKFKLNFSLLDAVSDIVESLNSLINDDSSIVNKYLKDLDDKISAFFDNPDKTVYFDKDGMDVEIDNDTIYGILCAIETDIGELQETIEAIGDDLKEYIKRRDTIITKLEGQNIPNYQDYIKIDRDYVVLGLMDIVDFQREIFHLKALRNTLTEGGSLFVDVEISWKDHHLFTDM